jgi:hypothetical protein
MGDCYALFPQESVEQKQWRKKGEKKALIAEFSIEIPRANSSYLT